LVKIDIGSHPLKKSLLELKNLKVLKTGNLVNTVAPPWITKLRILNRASSWKLDFDRIMHVTALKFLHVEDSAQWADLTQLTQIEILHVPQNFPVEMDLRDLVNLKTLKLLPPLVSDDRWHDWLVNSDW
jgi:hypothetical protein